MAEKGAAGEVETLGGGMGRKEKRKALKKQKRKQIRKEVAVKEREQVEALANDPEEQLRIRLREQEEAKITERERKAFEEHERLWLEAAARRAAEEEERKRLDEENNKEKVEHAGQSDEGEDWEYIEDGPAEIIWKENEIIVKKKKVKVPKRNADQQPNKEDDDRPTSNPLPPQSAAFAAFKSTVPVSAQEVLENVAQQIPNFGTEQDKAHCPFHLKTGACRFGLRCSRVHFYPDKSCTLLIRNMYNGPGLVWEQDEGLEVCKLSRYAYTDEEVERCYEEFYEDVHTEFLKFGEIVNFKVCRNGSFHLRGNVYVHYKSLESAVLAYNTLNGRFFAGKQITCEFVAITKWKAAICGEYMKSRLKTCSHGTACNFIHCFRNPSGDYEWADWDNPPPKYWVKKMAALFGYSPEIEYDKHVEMENRKRQSDSSWKRTPRNSRYHSSRSRYRETDIQDSDSGRDDSDRTRHRYSRHLSRSQHSHERRRATRSPDKPGHSVGNHYTRDRHTDGNYTSHGRKSNLDDFGGEEPDEKLQFKQRENIEHGRKRRRGESSNHARETVYVVKRDKSGRREKSSVGEHDKSETSFRHDKKHSKRHKSSDWDTVRDDDNSDHGNCHSTEKTPYEYETHDSDLKYKDKDSFGDHERLDRESRKSGYHREHSQRQRSSDWHSGSDYSDDNSDQSNCRSSERTYDFDTHVNDLKYKEKDNFLGHEKLDRKFRKADSSKRTIGEVFIEEEQTPENKRKGEGCCNRRDRSLDWDSGRAHNGENNGVQGDIHSSEKGSKHHASAHEPYSGGLSCNGRGSDWKISCEKRCSWSRHSDGSNALEEDIKHGKLFASDGSSSGGSDNDRVYGDTEFVEERTHVQLIHKSSRSRIRTDARDKQRSGSCFGKVKNHRQKGDREEIKEENKVVDFGNLESEKGAIRKHSRSHTPHEDSSRRSKDRSHHCSRAPYDTKHA